MRDVAPRNTSPFLPRCAVIGTISEVVLGGVFVTAATAKLITSQDTLRLIEFLGPGWVEAQTVLIGLVAFEWILGLLLISGVVRSVMVPASVALLAAFSGLLVYAEFRGYEGSCGCFALGESVQTAAIRNVFLIGIGVLAMVMSSNEGTRILDKGEQA